MGLPHWERDNTEDGEFAYSFIKAHEAFEESHYWDYDENYCGACDGPCDGTCATYIPEQFQMPKKVENTIPFDSGPHTMQINEIQTGIIIFDNGTTLTDHHDQDCCEYVYADFEFLKNYNIVPATGKKTSVFGVHFDPLEFIEPVEGAGFNLVDVDGNKWFVPCYDEQNGYYSSNLSLILITNDKKETEIDITECSKYIDR